MHFCRITSTIKQQLHLHNFHIKHLKSLRHVSILSDHHQGALLFLAKVILHYSQFNFVFANKVLWQHVMLCRNDEQINRLMDNISQANKKLDALINQPNTRHNNNNTENAPPPNFNHN